MRQVCRVTADGFFVEDVILGDKQAVPSDCVTQQPDNTVGLYWPKWEGSVGEDSVGAWVEGGGLYRREQDGSVDPAKRHDPIVREDGTAVRRDAAGKIFERSKQGVETEVVRPPRLTGR